jgi:hypothetical protein
MKTLALLALCLVACGGSTLTQDDGSDSTGTDAAPPSKDSLACALDVAKTVCALRSQCNGATTPEECARGEAQAMRGLTCACDASELAACRMATASEHCSSDVPDLGLCAHCFQ